MKIKTAIIEGGYIANVIVTGPEWTAPVGMDAMPLDEALAAGFTREPDPFPDRKIWQNAAAFLGEFSLEEMAAISLSTDPTIAALRLLLASWPADVRSDDPRIQLGLGKLVEVGIIDEARKASILAMS